MATTNNAALVGVGAPDVDGAIWIADKGATVPQDLRGELGDAFKSFGYVSDDGVTLSEDSDSNEVTAWGGDTVRVIKTSYKETAEFTPIEVNETVLEQLYGSDNVTTSSLTATEGQKACKVIVSKHTAVTLPDKTLVIKTCPADNMMVVYVARAAQLTERGDASLNGSDPMGRQMTYTCKPDDEGVTITSYTYIDETA